MPSKFEDYTPKDPYLEEQFSHREAIESLQQELKEAESSVKPLEEKETEKRRTKKAISFHEKEIKNNLRRILGIEQKED